MADKFAGPTNLTLSGIDEFVAFAGAFARSLQAGDVVALSGALGSGKTTFVRAAVSTLHGEDQTSSPTFTFLHRYAGAPPIDHIDLYRIQDPAELTELGLEDAFDGDSIVFVEWWTNAPAFLAERAHLVSISGAGDEPRHVELGHT